MTARKEVDPEERADGEELRGVEGGETIVKINCMRTESVFNKRKKKGRWLWL